MRRQVLMFPLLVAALVCAGPKEVGMVRQPAVADQFYPGDGETLAAMIDSMLADVEPARLSGKLIGIQVPHAGYPYSGPTAAHAFKLLAGMESVTVVMLGPSHRVFVDKAAVYPKGKWRTPLGDVPVDEELARAILASDSAFVEMPQAHALEHSLEVQVPWLQRAAPKAKVVPIMLLQPSYDLCVRIGNGLARASAGKRILLLASTDLYHGESYSEAKKSDAGTVERFVEFEPRALYDSLARGEAQACGGYAVVAAMVAARSLGATEATLLAQTNSNDVTNAREGYCVGYSAVAFTAPSGRDDGVQSDDLTAEEQQSLLSLARRTIEGHVKGGKTPGSTPLTSRLAEKRGVFVTLRERGELRGCIGYPEAVRPLHQAVVEMAVSASTEDPRFPPVTAGELGQIHIEITVLSPLRRIAAPESVVVGRHGLVIRKGLRSGLLLPQVPVEQGWDREQFLEGICMKAGLPRDAWKSRDAQLFVFTGQVFGEKK